MKMYRVDVINLTITPVEVDSEADTYVFINGRRKMKVTDYHVYVHSKDDAILVIRNEIEKNYKEENKND